MTIGEAAECTVGQVTGARRPGGRKSRNLSGGLQMNACLERAAGCIGFFCLLLLVSCGGGSMDAPAMAGDFTLTASPASVSLVPGGDGQQISLNAVPANGFTGVVSVAIA